MKRLLKITFCLLLTVQMCACPVKLTKVDNNTDNALLYIQRVVHGARSGGKVVGAIYCAACEPGQHGMSKATAEALTLRFIDVLNYAESAVKTIQVATVAGQLTLTAARRASIESDLVAIRGLLPTGMEPGLTSFAANGLQEIIAPITKSISGLLAGLNRIKGEKGDSTFEVTLTPKQQQRLVELQAEFGR